MKRHGNLYEKLISEENLHLAWQEARRGKSAKASVRSFEKDVEGNLARIRESLVQQTFQTSAYKTKTIFKPKKRLIYMLPFSPDRIVHHALMQVVEPIWTKLFITDSYACIRKRGIHAGSRRTMEFVRRNRYCLKMDISKFYPSVDHAIMFDIIRQKIKCPDTLYLNELDIFAKQTLRVKDYIRYCDDFLLFQDDKAVLGRMAREIETFLADRLALKLSKCDLFPVSRGVDFLGYRHFPGYVLLRKSTSIRIRRRLSKLPGLLEAGKITADQCRSTLASVAGWLRWADTYHLRLGLRMAELGELLAHGSLVGETASAV